MTPLLANYHPDIAPLVQEIQELLRPSLAAVAVTGLRVVLARVSDQSRKKFQDNLDEDMDWLCGHPQAAWVKANVTDVEAFRATPAGERARTKVGMKPLYAPGTKRLIGGFLARGGWLFIFLLSSAAKADLPQGRNAATEAILASLLAVAHDDPHATSSRPLLYAHALDRILRAEEYAWAVFNALTRTYALVDAAGRQFDALGLNSKDEWTLITFGAARGRDDIARRFLLARLNKARAGNWPGTIAGLPRGFMPSAERDTLGRFNLHPEPEQQSVRRPVPDPQQRWEVRAIAAAALDHKVTKFASLARACGKAGITSRGADEAGLTMDQLRDLTSAGRLLLPVEKIRAYCTGKLRHTETGVSAGQFNPGDGHRLTPRFPGDALGAVAYDVNVGVPEEQGWSWGVTPKNWRDILLKFWLPENFTPNGWAWTDDPEAWDWDQIRKAAESRPAQPTGQAATDQDQRPFSGLIAWSDPTHRYLLHCTNSPPSGDRYELRREAHTESRRNAAGDTYRMASTDGEAISSWPVTEFHENWADLAEQAFTDLIDVEPDTSLALHPDALTTNTAAPDDRAAHEKARADRAAAEAKLRDSIAQHRGDADALKLSAAHKRMKGDEEAAGDYEALAKAASTARQAAEQALQQLLAQPLPASRPAQKPTADFGRPAAVIAALRGAFASGAAPMALHDALREAGGEATRLYVLDAATMTMTVTVSLRRTDGTRATATRCGTLRRSRPNLATDEAKKQREDAKAELARKWFYDGITLQTLTKLSGAQPEHAYRIVREQLATGAARTVGQADLTTLAADRIPQRGLRAAIAAHPVPEARACVWSALNPADAPPAHVHPGYPNLIENTYRQADHAWDPRTPMRDPRGDSRVDALTVLRNLPNPAAPIRSDHLAALVGVPVRHINAISTDASRAHTPTPASLRRVGGWAGPSSSRLPAEHRTVGLLPCPWRDCDSTTADAVLLFPEVVIGAEASVVCRSCLRPPTSNVALPDSYRPLIAAVENRTGTLVQCTAPGCTTDLGAGPGVLWRWDDTPARHVDAHPACMPATQRQPTNAAIRLWASGHGLAVTDRGRIPAAVRDAYLAHHEPKEVPERQPPRGDGDDTS